MTTEKSIISLPTTYDYRGSDGSTAAIHASKERNGYAVKVYWPAGCQDFPDVLRATSVKGLRSQFAAAEAMVTRRGFHLRSN